MEQQEKPKMALCIRFVDAPSLVRKQCYRGGTALLPLYEEFFSTPVALYDRKHCETDENLLQLLPYIVVRNRNGHVLRYFRGKGGTEDRLHSKISIGLGGHIETVPNAGNLFDHCKADAMRELEEEIGVRPDKIEFVRLVFNPTGVNRVHLGILGVAIIDTDALTLETGVIEDAEFVDPKILTNSQDYNRCEEWSKAALWYIELNGVIEGTVPAEYIGYQG